MYLGNDIFPTDDVTLREAQLKKDYWREESRWPKSFSQSPHSQGHSHHPRLTELQDLHLDLQLQSKPHPGQRFYPARQHGNTVGVLYHNVPPDTHLDNREVLYSNVLPR